MKTVREAVRTLLNFADDAVGNKQEAKEECRGFGDDEMAEVLQEEIDEVQDAIARVEAWLETTKELV